MHTHFSLHIYLTALYTVLLLSSIIKSNQLRNQHIRQKCYLESIDPICFLRNNEIFFALTWEFQNIIKISIINGRAHLRKLTVHHFQLTQINIYWTEIFQTLPARLIVFLSFLASDRISSYNILALFWGTYLLIFLTI